MEVAHEDVFYLLESCTDTEHTFYSMSRISSDNECKVLVVFFNRLKQNGKKTFLMFLDIIENGGR